MIAIKAAASEARRISDVHSGDGGRYLGQWNGQPQDDASVTRHLHGNRAIGEVDIQRGAVPDCRSAAPRQCRDHLRSFAVILHGFGIVAGIGEHNAVTIDNGYPGTKYLIRTVSPQLQVFWRI